MPGLAVPVRAVAAGSISVGSAGGMAGGSDRTAGCSGGRIISAGRSTGGSTGAGVSERMKASADLQRIGLPGRRRRLLWDETGRGLGARRFGPRRRRGRQLQRFDRFRNDRGLLRGVGNGLGARRLDGRWGRVGLPCLGRVERPVGDLSKGSWSCARSAARHCRARWIRRSR